VTDGDLLNEAMAELYSSDLGEFTERRGALAARARADGQPSVAKQIAALRKPTRSAWVVNQLVHADPDVAVRLAALGDELRTAERSVDGARIRELSVARRQLIEALVRQAFAVSGQPVPPGGLREEVTATLTAALADPQVAEQLRAGTMLRPARWDGFGSAAASTLTPVPVPAEGHPPAALKAVPTSARPAPARPALAGAGPASPAPSAKATATSTAAAASARAAAREAAERDRHRAAIAAAEQAVAEADRAAEAAASAEQEQENAVALLEEQVADARRRLYDASREARRANSELRQARRALDRMRG